MAQDDASSLVITKRCNACHELSEASLGPPWQAIAARHAARKDLMVDVLASKIVHGGGGNWGNVPMVPNQRVAPDEAKRMAAWILNLSSSGN
jgi:cytochrome c